MKQVRIGSAGSAPAAPSQVPLLSGWPRIAPMLATRGKLPPVPVDDAYAYEVK